MNSSFLFHVEYDKELHEIKKYYLDSKHSTFFETTTFFKPIFLIQKEFFAIYSSSDVTQTFTLEENFSSIDASNIIKITPHSKEAQQELLEYISTYSLQTFEFDINESDYYLIETPEIIASPPQAKECKIISLDIETIGDSNNQTIILIALSSYSKAFSNRVFVNCKEFPSKHKHLMHTDVSKEFNEPVSIVWCRDEKDLLEQVIAAIKEFQPQFIIGWNVIAFDFKIIKQKCSVHNITFNFSKFQGETKMRISSDFFGKDYLIFPGMLVLDCIQLLKVNYIQYQDFKLNSVAKEVLGEEKIDLLDDDESDFSISEKIKTIEHNWNTNPIKLMWYNYIDTTLVLDIVEKIKLLDLMFERSVSTQTLFQRLQSPIAVLDQMYLKRLHKQKKVANTHHPTQGTTPIEGAYVIEPKSGLYNDIVVFDFASLYPSLMITFNIDPFTYSKQGEIVAPNNAAFVKKRGILPTILQELFQERVRAKSESNSVKSHALKITMNSFYGSMASPKSRYYNKHLAEAITAFGRECLVQAKTFLESLNMSVIYGDTDSVFVQMEFSNNSSSTQKLKEIKQIEKKINTHFSSWITEKYGVESHLTIEGEKLFEKFFIASKKRYVGQDLDKKLHFTGMESVRGDWTQVAKEFQVKLIEHIFRDSTREKIISFILDEIKQLKKGEYDDKLVYTKKITKPLKEYTKMTPPHVKAARELEEFNGRVVEYVMTTQGPKHIFLYDNAQGFDYEHYIDKQLKGVSDEILEAIGLNFDEIVYNSKQNNLNKFF
ncbi:MAG: DNA polymerase domain-containing protein [Candidatus Nanoarchaeia archaeon]